MSTMKPCDCPVLSHVRVTQMLHVPAKSCSSKMPATAAPQRLLVARLMLIWDRDDLRTWGCGCVSVMGGEADKGASGSAGIAGC
jgi:hypothetical protein